MTLVYVTLVTHWVADFVLQTDWQAQNKSKNWEALARHVGTYTLMLLLVVGSFLVQQGAYAGAVLGYVLLNGVLHFATDAVTSRINSYLWQTKQVHNFFVSVGFDQLIHYVTLFATAQLLGFL